MIVSGDQKKIFLGVPKTGTITAETVLSPLGTMINERRNYLDLIESAKTKIQNFDESRIEKVYLFYRDPVERFISAINHLRGNKFLQFTIRYRPQWFPGIDLSEYATTIPMADVPPFPPELFPPIREDKFSACLNMVASIPPEQFFNDTELMTYNVHLRKQASFHQNIPNDKKIVLDFANFEANMRSVAVDFGAAPNVIIPKLNTSNKITTSLSPELEAAVKSHYAEDYALKS